ncbi:ionotropic receptor 21a [Danaus plexippus]|uniref:ionotropic receptor 21a n=1 Tax=Danaus plexippus TaxID=13037 RepID=UPI002AAFE33E|nr:ionotropic receptor 21a [Danaus plexippus]
MFKRVVDPIFHGNPKTREEMWHENFLKDKFMVDQSSSLIKLVYNITLSYLDDCTPIILYDNQIKTVDSYLFQNLFKNFPVTFIHGYIDEGNNLNEPKLLNPKKNCLHFILFLNEVKKSVKVLGKQSQSKVVVIARSSQWAIQEFLALPISRSYVNLLIIGQSFKDENNAEAPYIMYTHILYVDGLGASRPEVLCSWGHGKFSRNVDLFPEKMTSGYAGHRFVVAAANQPPFVFKRIISDADGGNPRIHWDGLEIRILNLLAKRNNFTIEIIEPRDLQLGSGEAVSQEIILGRADIGVAGLFITSDRIRDMDMSFSHSHDCAAFITLTSTALPRYRAILGPFHWHVWVALTFTYLIAIFPLAFSDKHTLLHLINNKGEVENMFWYVFGTFTNCFTFVGKNSWSKTTKITTRLLIGWYWVFTIIITSCYTGSIIAFVTLPVFPDTVDTIGQLLGGFYRIGTLDRGGWERWFMNSSDPLTNKLLKKVELVPDVRSGIRNTTKAFFWSYAFLGSKAELEYIVQANYSKAESKRAVLHISNECFVPFGVSIAFPKGAVYGTKLSSDLRSMLQTGIIDKLADEVRWEMQRSDKGKLLSVKKNTINIINAEEKGLTLEDTQGMFLLLGAGFLCGAVALLSELMGGFSRRCRILRRRLRSNQRSKKNLINTPKLLSRELKLVNEGRNRRRFDTRSSSIESNDTLNGEIINVSKENITVHRNYDDRIFGSRRSSSMDIDREVQELFGESEHGKVILRDANVEIRDEKENTASKVIISNPFTNK